MRERLLCKGQVWTRLVWRSSEEMETRLILTDVFDARGGTTVLGWDNISGKVVSYVADRDPCDRSGWRLL